MHKIYVLHAEQLGPNNIGPLLPLFTLCSSILGKIFVMQFSQRFQSTTGGYQVFDVRGSFFSAANFWII